MWRVVCEEELKHFAQVVRCISEKKGAIVHRREPNLMDGGNSRPVNLPATELDGESEGECGELGHDTRS